MRSGKARHSLLLRTLDVSQGRESLHDVHLFPLWAARGHSRSVKRDSTRIVDWIHQVTLVEMLHQAMLVITCFGWRVGKSLVE